MRNIEKELYNSICITDQMLSVEEICTYIEEYGSKLLDIIFNLINNALDQYDGQKSLKGIEKAFEYTNMILINATDNNTKQLSKRICKLEEKIDSIIEEKSQKFTNKTTAYKELGKIRNLNRELERFIDNPENKQYKFMTYLIYQLKNITYIEYTLNKIPGIVNVKDIYGKSIYSNIIDQCINCIENDAEEDYLYYSGILTLIDTQKKFYLSDNEKKDILEKIYKYIDWFSCRKKTAKINKNKIEKLKVIKDIVTGDSKNNKNINEIALKYSIPISFDERLINELNLYTTPISRSNYPERLVVDDYIITIDDFNAHEIDDSLSCKKLENGNYLLGVHIASILGYIPYSSPLIEEAFKRVNSIYLPRKNRASTNELIPMFPLEFSSQKASLLEGQPKLARSYYYEIDKEGNVINQKFLKTIITSNKKTTYQEVDKILDKGSTDERLQSTVMNLEEVTECLARHYHPSELYEMVKENSLDYSDLKVKRMGAEKIVYLTMLLTGNRVGEFFGNSKEGYPCLYRVHQIDEKANRKIEDMIKTLVDTYGGEQYDKLYQLVNGIYPKCWYDLEGEHKGLGLKHYCHCTSGLRRAADIAVEHALEVCYDQNPTDAQLKALEEEMKLRATQINTKTKQIGWFVKEYNAKKPYAKKKANKKK